MSDNKLEMRRRMVAQIAIICHEIIRSYATAIGEDDPPAAWHDLTPDQKGSKCTGVELVLNKPNATPADLHESWLAAMIDKGWRLGATKNAVDLTHPCIRPYDTMPLEQQIKDHLFLACVRAVTYSQDVPQSPEGANVALHEDKFVAGPSKYSEGEVIKISDSVSVEVVALTASAQRASGYSVEDWNNLPQDDIDALFEGYLGTARADAAVQSAMGVTHDDFVKANEKSAPAEFVDILPPPTTAEVIDKMQEQHAAAKGGAAA